ncbi:hypothetical protein A2U01_0004433, partial [Trifolium medium]|nr:hypothetical protein [Trifolium medium]
MVPRSGGWTIHGKVCSFGVELLCGLIYFQTYVNLLHLKSGVCAKVIMVCLKFVEEFSGLNSAAYIYDGKTPGGFECATLCSPLVSQPPVALIKDLLLWYLRRGLMCSQMLVHLTCRLCRIVLDDLATSDCVGETLKETIPETNVVPSVGTFVAPATATYFDTSAAPETIIDHNVSDISYQMNTTEKENTTKTHALISRVLVFVVMFLDVLCYESSHPDLICSFVRIYICLYVLYLSLHCLVHANQGKYDLNSSANVNSAVDASTKVNSYCIDEYIKETVLETNVVPDVYTFVAPDTGVGKNDQDNPDQVDTTEQERTPVVVRTDNNSEPSVDKSVGDDPDVVIVNDIVAGDCFDKLVREFVVNVADNCDDPKNPEYRQVFVRG